MVMILIYHAGPNHKKKLLLVRKKVVFMLEILKVVQKPFFFTHVQPLVIYSPDMDVAAFNLHIPKRTSIDHII